MMRDLACSPACTDVLNQAADRTLATAQPRSQRRAGLL